MKINVRKRKQAGLAVAAAFMLSAFMPALSAAPVNSLVVSTGDTIKLQPLGSGGSYYGGSGGGEFLWTGVSSIGSFISFCIEEFETVSINGVYGVTLNSGAVAGGGFSGTYTGAFADVNGVAGFDPLSNATAWLYTKYMTDTAALTGFGAYSNANAGDVQKAIWFLENESVALLTGNALIWKNQAVAAANTGYTNPNVYVLNLSYDGEHLNQDQLYLANTIPEPETYAMLLAGLGLMGFVARRRQRKLAAV